MRSFLSSRAPGLASCVAALGLTLLASPAGAVGEQSTYSLHDLLVAALNTNLELQAKRLDPLMQDLQVDAVTGTVGPLALICRMPPSCMAPCGTPSGSVRAVPGMFHTSQCT